ncbi:YibE/F family protein [Patescibacteria group bacterium]|nr:YibE/F family protein [Patescibacteria group bacterium]
MQKFVIRIFLPFILFSLFLLISPKSIFAQDLTNQVKEGIVIQILLSGRESFLDELVEFQELEIEVTKGEKKGELIKVKNSAAGQGMVSIQYQQYQVGDKVKIATQQDMDGETIYSLDGMVKRGGLLTLTVLFIAVVLLVGRIWGALSLLGLITSFVVIFKLIIPLIIKGINPVLAAILGSMMIVPATFYISHGFNKKTHVGVVATFISLVITGLLAVYFVDVTHLTGFASEEAGFLQVERQGSIDIRGLLLAGIIISTLGILDDVTIGQASVVKQLKKANPKISFLELFKNGMKVGQDHISSMVNTLVLVYSGSALPLLLLFFDSQKTFVDILEFELIAEEIVRMLVGSIGLVLAAPLATIMAAYIFSKGKNDN